MLWTDLPLADRQKVLDYIAYVKTELPAVFNANGGTVTGTFLDTVLTGSFGKGIADEFSDIDLLIITTVRDAFAHTNKVLAHRMRRCVLYGGQLINQVPRPITPILVGKDQVWNHNEDFDGSNLIGFSLESGFTINTVDDLP